MFREEIVDEYLAFHPFAKKFSGPYEVCFIPSAQRYCIISNELLTWSSSRVECFDLKDIADIYVILYERYPDIEVLISKGTKADSRTVVKSALEVLALPNLKRFKAFGDGAVPLYLIRIDRYAVATEEGLYVEDSSFYSLSELRIMSQQPSSMSKTYSIALVKNVFQGSKVIP